MLPAASNSRVLLLAAAGLCGIPPLPGAEPGPRVAAPTATRMVAAAADQPAGYRYLAFPSMLRTGPDEVWLAYKAGGSHAADAGAAMEVVRHTLSTGVTQLVQRLPAPPPKLYQMGELVRLPDGVIALYIDVQSVGWDGRHYRSGVETFRWGPVRSAFGPSEPLPAINGVHYGYPFDFLTEGRTTWLLVMAFGYQQPGGRWSVDAVRSDDAGRSWRFVRNLAAEFGGLRLNESALARHGTGFLVATRGYDRMARLHRTDGDFRVRQQVDLTGRHPHIHDHVGRPRLFLRDGHGYLLGRTRTRPAVPMQLCLIRFHPETLVVTSVVILDHAPLENVSDGYYAVSAFSGVGAGTRLHVFTYKGAGGASPDIIRLDYRWDEVK